MILDHPKMKPGRDYAVSTVTTMQTLRQLLLIWMLRGTLYMTKGPKCAPQFFVHQ